MPKSIAYANSTICRLYQLNRLPQPPPTDSSGGSSPLVHKHSLSGNCWSIHTQTDLLLVADVLVKFAWSGCFEDFQSLSFLSYSAIYYAIWFALNLGIVWSYIIMSQFGRSVSVPGETTHSIFCCPSVKIHYI